MPKDIVELHAEFEKFCRDAVDFLRDRVQPSSYNDLTSGSAVEGFYLKEMRSHNDDRIVGTEWLGSDWGRTELFLGVDGRIYEYTFSGSEVKGSETVYQERVDRLSAAACAGSGVPFSNVKKLIDRQRAQHL